MQAATESPMGDRPRSTRRRVARAGLLVAAGLGALWVGAIAWANSPAVTGRLRAEAERALRQRLATATLGDGAAVDLLGRLRLGPLTVPASHPGVPPVVRVERVVVRPRWLALLDGRAEPAVVSLAGVRVEAGPIGEELAALARRLPSSGRPVPRLPSGPGAAPPEV
ncbi:MAG TPA: glycosyl transferase, partial [Anaeromyxobacteraceae bacterium]